MHNAIPLLNPNATIIMTLQKKRHVQLMEAILLLSNE